MTSSPKDDAATCPACQRQDHLRIEWYHPPGVIVAIRDSHRAGSHAGLMIHIDAQAREFEELKPYLVTRWREMRAAASVEP